MDATADQPAVTALAPWFGAKRNMAPLIVEELGPHRAYWEPFCGSMAVLLAKEPAGKMETVNDLHAHLTNVARVIQHPRLGAELYRRLRRVLMNETLHAEAAARHRSTELTGDEPDLDAAADYFLCSWIGRNGVAGTGSYKQGFCVQYTANGGCAAKRWQSAVNSIPAWRRRLANVAILRRDAFELLARVEDKSGTVIYADPPYVEKGAKYVHDLVEADHRRLAELLRRFTKSRVVVSYYDHPLVRELYDGWTIRCIEVTKALVNQGMRDKGGATKAVEVLCINGPSFAADGEPAKLF